MDKEGLRSRLEVIHGDAFGWALACCRRDPETAREVLQMTYLKILEGRARWNGHASFRTWLFAVVRTTAAGYRRTTWLRSIGLDRLSRLRHEATPPPDPEAGARSSEAAGLLRRALHRLPARQRDVLHLVFYSGLTVDEAGEVLNVSPGAARRHYERGKSRLRRLLPREVEP